MGLRYVKSTNGLWMWDSQVYLRCEVRSILIPANQNRTFCPKFVWFLNRIRLVSLRWWFLIGWVGFYVILMYFRRLCRGLFSKQRTLKWKKKMRLDVEVSPPPFVRDPFKRFRINLREILLEMLHGLGSNEFWLRHIHPERQTDSDA